MPTSTNPLEASLKRIDGVCGGAWWRHAWLAKCPDKNATEAQKMAAEEAVVAGYAEKLREHAGAAGTWIIDVRPRADLKPVYYLIFATRHIDGMLAFGESASLGLQAWRRYLAKEAAEDTLFGTADGWEDGWKAQEAVLKAQWVEAIASRLSDELAKGEPFRLIDRADEVLGDLVGVARGMHLRAAVKKVLADKKTITDPKGVDDLWRLLLKPA